LKLFLVLVKPKAEPVLISDSFAWGSFFVGPIWLAARRAWIAAGLSLATYVLIAVLAPPLLAAILSLSVAVFLGLHGHDLQVWALEHRGYTVVHLVAGNGWDEAWMRLMTHRPDLAARLLPEAS